MAAEEKLKRNLSEHKLLILMLKYMPMLIALAYMLNTIAFYFGIEIDFLSNLAGMSLITWIYTYLSSIVFKFCKYHRMFLWYILIDDSVAIADYYVDLPVTTDNLLMIHTSLIGLLLFVILYIYVKDNKGDTVKDSR